MGVVVHLEALGRQRKEYQKFEANLVYIPWDPVSKANNKQKPPKHFQMQIIS
jgi:hypothetical protein